MVEIERPGDHHTVNRAELARAGRWRRQMRPADQRLTAGDLDGAARALALVDEIHGYIGERQDYAWLLESIRRRRQKPADELNLPEVLLYRGVDDQLLRFGPRRAARALSAHRFAVRSVRDYERYERVLEGMLLRRQQDLLEREERAIEKG